LIAQFAGRNPHFWQRTIAQQNRQPTSIQLVGLMGQAHSPLRLERIAQPRPESGALHLVHQPTVVPARLYCYGTMRRQSRQKFAERCAIVRYAMRSPRLAFLVYGDEHRKILVCVTPNELFHTAAASFQVSLKFTRIRAAALS